MDWDGDGILDILSGCYWIHGTDAGPIHLLKGNGGGDFEPAVPLTNRLGKPLQNTQLNGDDERQILTICTHQHAVDYDGDDDLDLVVGCFGSSFYFYENSSNGQGGLPVLEDPIELPIKSPRYHSAPHLADWDNDGDLDLLSGTDAGGVVLSLNVGTRRQPKWSRFKELVPPSSVLQPIAEGQTIRMAPSTRVWTTDWDGDGLLDLLVGDAATIENPKAGKPLTPEELEIERRSLILENSQLLKRLDELQSTQAVHLKEFEEPDVVLEEQLSETMLQRQNVMAQFDRLGSYRETGFVWLLVRRDKPTEAKVN